MTTTNLKIVSGRYVPGSMQALGAMQHFLAMVKACKEGILQELAMLPPGKGIAVKFIYANLPEAIRCNACVRNQAIKQLVASKQITIIKKAPTVIARGKNKFSH